MSNRLQTLHITLYIYSHIYTFRIIWCYCIYIHYRCVFS
nr:MAG TPA: hypothetical protein [Caudoviricetes sp.]